MKKMKSLFQRNYDTNRLVRDEIVPGSEWVANGEGWATRKWDGLAILVKAPGKVYQRYDAKKGRTPPPEFIPAQPEADPETGHWPGWVPLHETMRHIWQAFDDYQRDVMHGDVVPNGTYEVCGPRIGTRHGANPENLTTHILVSHGRDVLLDCPRTFAELKEYLSQADIEGVVWYHPDGRRVKIKAADFGIERRKNS